MTPEEREKAIQIMVERHTSNITRHLDKRRALEYATFHYNLYSDEALLSLILNYKDHNVYSTT
jgi:hypothetical protein